MSTKDNFIIHLENQEDIEELTDEEAGRLFKALLRYVGTGEVTGMDRVEKAVFNPIRRRIDKDAAEYERVCEKNRINGAKGGRPPGKPTETQNNPTVILGNPPEPNGNPSEPKKPDTDTDHDTDIDDIDKNNISARVREDAAFNKASQKFLVEHCGEGTQDFKYDVHSGFLGLRKKYGTKILLQALRRMEGRSVSEPVKYLESTCGQIAHEHPKASGG